MNKYLISGILCIAALLFLYWQQSQKSYSIESRRIAFLSKSHSGNIPKKVIIFSGPGGQGHESATMALTEYLEYKYTIQTVYLIKDVLTPLDFVYTITFGNFHSEEFYNYCLLHNHIWLINAMVWLGLKVFDYQYPTIKSLIKNYILDQNPDMIISVIPAVNAAASAVAQELNIPLWIIPTDLDPLLFAHKLYSKSSKQVYFNIPYAVPDLHNKINPALLKNITITSVGFPVRRQFLHHYNTISIKSKYQIPFDKPVVMVMMGGLGVNNTEQIVAGISAIDKPIHYIICIGKNEPLRSKINMLLEGKSNISYTITSFTPVIAPLMAASDLLITKAGGATINEALYMELPMIIDGTTSSPQWEYYNWNFLEAHECAIILKKLVDLPDIISSLIENKKQLAAMKHSIKKIPKENTMIKTQDFVASLLNAY